MPQQQDITAGIGFRQPFQDQLDFFRSKLNLPTERWDDIMRAAHDRAFIVAGAAKADLLQDLRRAVDDAIAKGISIGEFRRQFAEIVARHGWTGWTGQGTAGGQAWRTRVIYQTNLQTSYAAGRWRQLNEPAVLAGLPYWEYVHRDGVLHPRPQHLAWHGLTLRHDDAFWRRHYPPNGWGCHCRVRARARPRAGLPTERPADWDEIDPKTQAPRGIDKGFDYAPGAQAGAPLRDLIDQKLFRLEAPIGARMHEAMRPVLQRERTAEFGQWVSKVTAEKRPRGEWRVVGAIAPDLLQAMATHAVTPKTAELVVRDEDVLHTFRDAKKVQLAEDWYRGLPDRVDSPAAVVLDKTVADSPALLYVFDLPEQRAKLVLSLDYTVARRNAEGKKERVPVNIFRTGRLVDPQDLDQPGYVWLRGR